MAKLKPGDVVASDCEQVDQLPPRALALAGDGTLAEVADGSGVMARGQLFLASRRDDYVAELSGNGLAVCEDFHPFAAAGAPLRLALELATAPVGCAGPLVLVFFYNAVRCSSPGANKLVDGETLPYPLRTPLPATYAGESWRLRLADFQDGGGGVTELGAGSVGPDGSLTGLPDSVNFTRAEEVHGGPGVNWVYREAWAEVTCQGQWPPDYEVGVPEPAHATIWHLPGGPSGFGGSFLGSPAFTYPPNTYPDFGPFGDVTHVGLFQPDVPGFTGLMDTFGFPPA